MLLTSDTEEHVNVSLREAISRLCKMGLKFNSQLAITGLLAVTIDCQEVFLVNIHEVILDEGNVSANNVTTGSYENGTANTEENCGIDDLSSNRLNNLRVTRGVDIVLNKSTVNDNSMVAESRRRRSTERSQQRRSFRSDCAPKQQKSEKQSSEQLMAKQWLSGQQLLNQRLSEQRLLFDNSSDQPLSRNGTRSNSPSEQILRTPFCVKLEPTEPVKNCK